MGAGALARHGVGTPGQIVPRVRVGDAVGPERRELSAV